jgi:hypothetical protein
MSDSLDMAAVDEDCPGYLFVSEPGRAPSLAILDVDMSQLLRRTIARKVGKEKCWDYRSFPNTPAVAESILRFRRSEAHVS